MDKNLLQLMLGSGFLLMFSIFVSKTSSRLGIPILLIFIAVGMLAGSEGLGGIEFDNAYIAQILGTISLIFILFSGGLSTHLKVVKPIWREGLTLATAGVLLTTGVMAFFIRYTMDWGWVASGLLGAAISSTDAAAVFGILKTSKLELKGRIQALLELESGSNDPMAVFLTLSLIQMVREPQGISWSMILIDFFIQMSLGGLAGWFFGKGLVRLMNWLNLEFEGLYPVLTISGVVCIYSLTEYCGGNGFLSVYLAGVTMGSEKYFSKRALGVFHDGLAWLMQVVMFLTLGLLVFPSEIMPVMRPGILLSLGLIFVARPLSTILCLLPYRYGWREMWFISWGGLRGAVPIILATYFLVGGVPESKTMFNLVFFIVIISMIVQGGSLSYLANWLNVQEKNTVSKKLAFKSRLGMRDFIEYSVPDDSKLIGQCIFQLQLPDDVLVVLIHRQNQDFIPKGNTEIKAQDRLVCLADKKKIPEMEAIFGRGRDGSSGQN